MPAPTRPLLIPGAHPLRRHDGRLQVGLDPSGAVVLPPQPEVPALLRGLDGSTAPTGSAPLDALAAAGALVGEQAVTPLLGASTSPTEAARVAALVRSHGERAPEAARQRSSRHVGLVAFGPGGERIRTQVTALLEGAGLAAYAADALPPDRRLPDLGLLVGVGEPDRDLLDDWLRARVPHLLLRLTEGSALVGPFVLPGESSCLRCIDAHYTDADPTWPLLVRQYAEASRSARYDRVPEPVDPLLTAAAVGWLARDAATWCEGDRPSLWSAVLRLDPTLREVECRSWRRHPACGCSWQ